MSQHLSNSSRHQLSLQLSRKEKKGRKEMKARKEMKVEKEQEKERTRSKEKKAKVQETRKEKNTTKYPNSSSAAMFGIQLRHSGVQVLLKSRRWSRKD